MTAQINDATAVLITSYVSHYKSKDGNHTNTLGRFLTRYANTILPGETPTEGVFSAPPINSLPTYFRRNALADVHVRSRAELDSAVSESRKKHGADHERLPAEVLLGLISSKYVVVVEQFIADGPEVSGARVNALLRNFVEESVRATSRRKNGGKPSDSAVNDFRKVANKLWNTLLRLRQSGRYPELEPWSSLPTIDRSIQGLKEATNKVVPTWSQVRLARQHLSDEISGLLGAASLDDELDAIARLPAGKLATAERLLLNRVELAVLANTGARITSVLEIKLKHLEDRGDRGILEHYPKKTVDAETAYPKSLHPLTMKAVESYLALRYLRRGVERSPEDPLLTASTIRKNTPMRSLSYTTANKHVRKILNGPFTPHTVRSATAQVILSKQGLRAFAIHEFDYEPLMIAEVQLDHTKIPGDLFGYNGYASRASRIEILRHTGLIIGDLFWTDVGARHVKDAKRFTQCLEQRRAFTEQIDFLRQERRSLAPTDRARTVNARYHTITDEIELLRDKREAIEKEINSIRFDPEYEIPVADEVDQPPRVNLNQIEKEFLHGTSAEAPTVYPRVRDWLTIKEFAGLVGVSVKTISRHIDPNLRQETTGVRERTRREYWDPMRPPIDSQLGVHHRRIFVGEVYPNAYAAPEQARALDLLLAGPPQEQWGPACMATACVPDYRRHGTDH